MTAPVMTRDQAAAAAKAAVAERDAIQANLLELDSSFGKQLLAEAGIQLEQVGLDRVALGHGRLDCRRDLIPGHHRHRHIRPAMPLPVIGTDEP